MSLTAGRPMRVTRRVLVVALCVTALSATFARTAGAEMVVTLVPAAASAGAELTLEGTGFPAGARERVSIAGRTVQHQVGRGGQFSTRVRVPARAKGWVQVTSSGGAASVISRVRVVSPPARELTGEVASASGARVRWAPLAAAPRARVALSLSGARPGQRVVFQLAGERAVRRASGSGSARVRLRLPRGSRSRRTGWVRVGGVRLPVFVTITPTGTPPTGRPPTGTPPTGSPPTSPRAPTPGGPGGPAPAPTPGGPLDGQPAFPIRAAFYYPWFPEAWDQQGISPYTRYHPSLGLYDASAETTGQHLRAMQYGGIQAAVASWWGQGSRTDGRISAILSTTWAVAPKFRWSLYHENESQGDPTPTQLASDLTYIRDRYGLQPAFLRVNGRFVVFVYADAQDGCGMVDRWTAANATIKAYLVLKVFPGYRQCASQPDSWHQYSPAVARDSQAGASFAVSPGFYQAGLALRLARDLARWRTDVRDMVASGAPWQLVTTFNEWGEGTAVESATEWASASGFGDYLDVLHESAPPAPVASGLP